MKPSSQPLSIASSLLLALTLTAGICSSSGQSGAATGPAPAQNGPPPQPAAVVLSPFEVQTSRDVGFVATSSLAGGRLAGDLKDTPAAYSVLTREFIDALGITDLTSASEWTVNSFSSPTNGSGEIFGATTEITTRGVSGGPQQRDFFPLNVNYDSYNLERFDFARGSNSILFGAGTFGGTANVVTKSARTDHSFENLQVTYGSWDNLRATLDVNVPIAKIGAVRVNALWSNRDGWRDFEREGKKAVTLGTTLKPLPHTELQFEGEFGIISRNMPGTYLNDQFTGWDGKTTFSTPLASAPSNANAVGVRLNGSTNAAYFVYAPGLNPGIINLGGTARTIGGLDARRRSARGRTFGQ
jgi:outer membrane receptor protein involved in Fe transport